MLPGSESKVTFVISREVSRTKLFPSLAISQTYHGKNLLNRETAYIIGPHYANMLIFGLRQLAYR